MVTQQRSTANSRLTRLGFHYAKLEVWVTKTALHSSKGYLPDPHGGAGRIACGHSRLAREGKPTSIPRHGCTCMRKLLMRSLAGVHAQVPPTVAQIWRPMCEQSLLSTSIDEDDGAVELGSIRTVAGQASQRSSC